MDSLHLKCQQNHSNKPMSGARSPSCRPGSVQKERKMGIKIKVRYNFENVTIKTMDCYWYRRLDGIILYHLVSCISNNPLFLLSHFQILICNELLFLFPFFF